MTGAVIAEIHCPHCGKLRIQYVSGVNCIVVRKLHRCHCQKEKDLIREIRRRQRLLGEVAL